MVGPPPARPAGRGRPGLLTWPRGRVPWVHARENADLAHHGDADLVPGLVDLAVNVRSSGTPGWLAARIREADLAAYPDQRAAVAAVAARHRRSADEVLLTAGAAEAFVLLARALRPRHAVVVHPQFTEPEAALRAAGHQVDQLILPFPFTLDPMLVPADADLVFIGNPTNPTSVAHLRDALLRLVRPGRIVVVDEAFADCLPGEPESVAGQGGLDGLVVIRSLTKTWALAGLRAGYLLAAPDVVRLLAAAQPPWPVSSPALAACVATASAAAAREVEAWSRGLAAQRAHLLGRLADIDRVRTVPAAAASFVLLDTGIGDVRTRLHGHGFAVRRGETFPGLRPGWIRVAVRDPETSDRFTAALREVIADAPPGHRVGVPTGTAPQRTRPVETEPAETRDHPAGRRVLVLGGSRSGKSRHAEQLLAQAQPVTYVATAQGDPADAEWTARIERHRTRRPAGWATAETTDPAKLIHQAATGALLVDSVTTWLAGVMEDCGCWSEAIPADAGLRLADAVDRLVDAWTAAAVTVVAVSDEVGSGIVPGTTSGRRFRDALGELNQRLAAAADEVWLVTAGIPGRLR
jgi:histidinol-phosphate/aromatic aminotransferase/cobyric acid decarboxylase-like protein/adenosyl cobinamide kinase/adenosyl cobinamide phosphate guanylyltransferase